MLGIRTIIRHVSASLKWAKANEYNRTQLGRWTIGLDNVTIGDYSYGEINVLTASKQPKLAIGELCSIAPNVTFVIHNNHPIDHFTTFPLRRFVLGETYDEACGNGGIVVEEDVWIGYGATILDGVHIGRGGSSQQEQSSPRTWSLTRSLGVCRQNLSRNASARTSSTGSLRSTTRRWTGVSWRRISNSSIVRWTSAPLGSC